MAAKKKPKRTRPSAKGKTNASNPAAPREPLPSTPPEIAPDEAMPDAPGPPVVGIGASAGGLDAFKKFFIAMPPDSGVAFVLIPHLDPKHESLMVELLARHTPMPVVEAADGAAVEADHVYIIPPNKYMTIANGTLRLTGPIERGGPQTSIDVFLRSLAEDKREKSICIILSGTGTHGALGLKAVKAAGGMAMTQDPVTADYPAMPRSAIATGLADYVLPVGQMPQALIKYIQRFCGQGGEWAAEPRDVPDDLAQALALVRVHTKLDFRHYRKKLLTRRVERRMSVNHFDRIADYLAFLREHPDEVRLLSKDMLISVTSFFRDPEAWRALDAEVIAPFVRDKDPDTPVRAWSIGCATGEEPYSLAILLLERLAAAQKSCPLQIFATDIDEEALDVARRASYPETIAADLSPERLSRFFTRAGDSSFQVNKQLRETVTFARQNIISDAPFSKLDLVVCRNLLIYLEPDLQKKIIALLHFALNEGGYLFLGPAETIGRHGDLFEPVAAKWRIYRRIGPSRLHPMALPVTHLEPRQATPLPASLLQPATKLAELAQDFLLRRFALACVVINRNYVILHFAGPTADYLMQPAGPPTHDLFSLARPGLETKLRAAVQRAIRDDAPQSIKDVMMRHGGVSRRVNIDVEPLKPSKQAEGLLLISFQEQSNPVGETLAEAKVRSQIADTDLGRQLKQELETTRAELQSTIEEQESANEELKASNEEIMSMNEELQSTNEELETTKEELQALNEELSTVNNQLNDKVQELKATNDDMANLLNCTHIATVFLDTALCIKRFTPAATELFKLIAGDVGRPIDDVVRRFRDDGLVNDARHLLLDFNPRDKEVQTDEGRWYVRRIIPYRTLDDRIAGVVITFIDVTERKQAADAIVRRLAAIVESSADAIFSKDLDGTIRTWNVGAERLYGFSADEAVGRSIQPTIPEDRGAEWTDAMTRLARGEHVEQMDTERLRKDGQRVPVALTYSPIRNAEGKIVSVSAIARDISERKRAEKALLASEERMKAIVNTASDPIITIDQRGVIQSVNPATERLLGYSAAEMIGQNVSMLMPSPYRDEHDGYLAHYLQTGERRMIGIGREVQARRKDGRDLPVDLAVSEVVPRKLFAGILRDLSRRKELETEVLEIAALEQQRIGQELHDDVGQRVAGLAMLADALAQHLAEDASPRQETAARVAAGLDELREQARSLSRGLVPVMVEADGLRAAFDDLVRRTCEQPGVTCALDCPPAIKVKDTTMATHLFRIAQEAVHNALRHGKARHIAISLVRQNHDLTLSIRDDGTGIPLPPDETKGLGIRLMRNRAGLIGGVLSIGPVPEGGALVCCTLPWRETHG